MQERRGAPPGDEMTRLSPEMVDWALDMMKTKLPRLHERLSKLRQENPERFERVFRKLMPFLKEYRSLQERRPELAETVLEEFKAEERLRELSREYQEAKGDAAKQAVLGQEMEQLVRKQFDLRTRRFESRLEDFEDRIKDQQLQLQMMKDRMQSMTNRKDDVVNRRVSQIKSGRMTEGFPGMGPGMDGPRPDGRPPRPPPGGEMDGPGDRPLPPPDEEGRPPPPDDGGPRPKTDDEPED